MILDSTDSLSIADEQGPSKDVDTYDVRTEIPKGAINNEPDVHSDAEVEKCADCSILKMASESSETEDWCYLYVHHQKAKRIVKCMEEDSQFNVFIHKTLRYRQVKKHAVANHESSPTISGLVFVQGNEKNIKAYLNENFPYLHLVNDCSTGRTAIIPDSVMQPFMQVLADNPTRIRILMRPFESYAQFNGKQRPLVRVMTGALAGLEGYVVRIDRDRKLVISVGTLTIALSDIHKEDLTEIKNFNNKTN